MKHVVEFFDGRKIRGLLVEQNHLSGFLSRVENLDPSLGAVILDVTPENKWRTKKRLSEGQWQSHADIDRERRIRVDQFLV